METTVCQLSNEHPELYKALLHNELATYFFSEAIFSLLKAVERREVEGQGSSYSELSEACYHISSMLRFALENRRIIKCKFKVVADGLNLYRAQSISDVEFREVK